MKTLKFLAVSLLVLFVTVPVYADESKDFIESEVADWNRIAIDNGYNILGSYIGSISGEDVYYTFDLAPGVYHFYASGGLNITDLDVYIFDMDGRELGSDAMSDKIPIVVINLSDRTEVSVQVQAFSYTAGYTTESFCIVLAAEAEGEVYSVSSETSEFEEVNIAPTEEEEEVEATEEVEEEESKENAEEAGGDQYMGEVEETLGYWETYDSDSGNETIDSGIGLVKDDGYAMNLLLEPGFYVVFALPDSRCNNLDVHVYSEGGALIVEDTLEDNFPYCEFSIMVRQSVGFVIDCPNEDRDFETYAAYLVAYVCGIDEDSRRAYIDGELDLAVNSSSETGEEIIDQTVDTISMRDPVVRFDVDLEAGSYWSEADGGIAIDNLDMRAFDSEGNILSEDTYEDNYPMVWLDLAEATTVTFEIELMDIQEGFDEDFYFWVLSSTVAYEGMEDYGSVWSGDEQELIDGAEMNSEWALHSVEVHGEEIIEEWTEPIDLDEDSKWTYELELDPGTYYIYAEGDGICLNDIDMYIYDDDGELVTQDEGWYNATLCRLDVSRSGGTYTIEVYAYWLDCEVGYFHMMLTREH